jgi:Flp pilus assembly pilin Flp
MKNLLKQLWQDQKGAVTTVELIGYTILIGGAAALVGFGLTTAYRGLTGSVIKEIQAADPHN